MNSEREIVKKLFESNRIKESKYQVTALVVEPNDTHYTKTEVIEASSEAEAKNKMLAKYGKKRCRDLRVKLMEDAAILPDKDEQDTIVRAEHHPISTADRPNIDMSESIEDEEDKVLDEKTYTVGDTQYWKRGGKCYSWTQSGGRQECSEEDYYKAISGGTDEPIKNTDPANDKARASNNTTSSAGLASDGKAVIDMNGYKYDATVEGMSSEEVVDKYNKIAKHSPGKAIQWIKKNGNLEKSDSTTKPKNFESIVSDIGMKSKVNNKGETVYTSDDYFPMKDLRNVVDKFKSLGYDESGRVSNNGNITPSGMKYTLYDKDKNKLVVAAVFPKEGKDPSRTKLKITTSGVNKSDATDPKPVEFAGYKKGYTKKDFDADMDIIKTYGGIDFDRSPGYESQRAKYDAARKRAQKQYKFDLLNKNKPTMDAD